MKINVKKLHPDAVLPKYATPGAAGFDLVAIEDVVIAPGETKLVKTGLAIDVGFGYQLEVRPRSGLSLKTPLRVANSPGTVDEDYRGEVAVIVWNSETGRPGASEGLYFIKKGDRIAQGVVMPAIQADIAEVDELPETVRGTGGFGSTGK